jgi:hypothetical protein
MSYQVKLNQNSFELVIVDEEIIVPKNKYIISYNHPKKSMYPTETKKFLRCTIVFDESRAKIIPTLDGYLEIENYTLFEGDGGEKVIFENCTFIYEH